jgi:hypothetical protein
MKKRTAQLDNSPDRLVADVKRIQEKNLAKGCMVYEKNQGWPRSVI